MVRTRVGERTRRAWVFLHVATSVGWMGAAAGNVALASTALVTDRPGLRHACYQSIKLIDIGVVIPLAALTVISGVVLSIIARWGLLTYWWVSTKALLTIAVILLSVVGLGVWVEQGIDAGPELTASAGLLVAGAAGNVIAFVLMTWLSVAKPWGHIVRPEPHYYGTHRH